MEHDAMTKKMPPVPPANRSSKGPPDDAATAPDEKVPQRSENEGQTDNIEQNTTNQGYQQNR
jgi:hypothetical protein